MATFKPSTMEDCKENSLESINIDNEKNISNDSINNSSKKEYYNERAIFYKKPIKKYNHKLELDFNDTPQEIRRQRMLYYQKQNRNNSFNAERGLLEEVNNFENEIEMEEEQVEEMDIDPVRKKYTKVNKRYARMLMLSEWMLEVPQDFADKWIMIPCPKGKRVLLTAVNGRTKMYSRKGEYISTFKTVLPGGSHKTNRNNCALLDCIWLKNQNICYVLDVLAWSNQDMLNCDAEFRFYWLRTQISDLPELKEKSAINDCSILPLPLETCDHDFYECLEKMSTMFALDGLLFFHKESHYTSGKTPLVTWLKTYMLPEILGMNVPEPYDKKPNSYIDFEHHILKVIETEKNAHKKRKQKDPEQELME